MTKIKENFLKKYGIGEYLLAALGMLFLFNVSRELWEIRIADMEWDTIFKLVVLTSFGALLQFYPLAVTEFVRKQFGMPTKSDNNDQNTHRNDGR
ncbi:hypothetical protein Q4603_05640 [Zobellia galactanivorans]|uniref:hypothetical protein n=1 Tax=Zobellia galactanivorans (strain DSM 12802 / CCUG 47099 / CIP 106680 / NCIMB 13871 / Dsij) TaxID=63186 RepID=UPI0026E1F4BE|nr:hypothetical protein [Zobellia galactanivorans]MDO6808077.1 hypothetical protein [Zobellia galactanivorans]